MAREILAIPEENLDEVIQVIRKGLCHVSISDETRDALIEWCEKEEEYIKR